MTSTDDIKFECDGCGQRLIVEKAAAGAEIACPICAHDLQVPHDEAFDPSALLGERNGHGHGAHHAHLREERPAIDEEEEFEPADSPAETHLLRRQLADANLLNERLERELEAANRKLAQAKEQGADRERQASETSAQARRRESELVESQNRVAALNHGLEREIEALGAKLARAQEEAARVREELQGASAVDTRRVAELADLQGRLQAREAELAARTGELATVSKGREKFEARVTELREELKTAQGERELSRQLATGLAAQLASREGELAEALAKMTKLTGDLRSTEGKLGVLEQESAAKQLELLALRQTAEAHEALRQEHEDLRGRLAKAEEANESLSRTCEEMHRETESLKRQLGDSAAGREMLALRERLAAVEGEAGRWERQALAADTEARKWREAEARSQEGLTLLRVRCEKAERHFEEGAEAALLRDCQVLRGIVERQKVEISQQHAEVVRNRRAQVALRLAYAIVAIVSLGAAAVIAHLLGKVL